MSMTFDKVRALVQRGEVRVSDHGYEEMSEEDILARDILLVFSTALWWKIILRMPKDPVFSYCKETANSGRFTSFGEFQRIYRHRRLW